MNQAKVHKDHPIRDPKKGSLSPLTVASRVRHLKRLFNWLEEEGVIQENPARRIKTPKPKRRKPKGISMEDFQALLRTTIDERPEDLRDRAIMMLLFDTACRVGGLCGLRVGDIDLDVRQAIITEKEDKTRIAFYTQATDDALAAWLDVRPKDNDWGFVSLGPSSFGKRLSTRGVSHMLIRQSEWAETEGPTNPHAFRHGFARAYLMAGGDLVTLSRIMGYLVSVGQQP